MTIGERIKSRRKELGLSVDDVAQMLSKNRATVYRYESDNIHQLPFSVLENLSHILNCSTNYLYSGRAEDNTQTIGERIKNKRIERKLTQSDVANAVGVATSTIARYEKGQIESVKMPVVESISRCLGVDMAWVLGKSNMQIDEHNSSSKFSLTHQEEELIIKYRSNPQMQEAVNKLLGI